MLSRTMTLRQREALVRILVNHWPNDNASCRMNDTQLGESWPEHIADLFEEALEAEEA